MFRLLEVRERLYELLVHCIPSDVIMRVSNLLELVEKLTKKNTLFLYCVRVIQWCYQDYNLLKYTIKIFAKPANHC